LGAVCVGTWRGWNGAFLLFLGRKSGENRRKGQTQLVNPNLGGRQGQLGGQETWTQTKGGEGTKGPVPFPISLQTKGKKKKRERRVQLKKRRTIKRSRRTQRCKGANANSTGSEKVGGKPSKRGTKSAVSLMGNGWALNVLLTRKVKIQRKGKKPRTGRSQNRKKSGLSGAMAGRKRVGKIRLRSRQRMKEEKKGRGTWSVQVTNR